jgi:hypothetical protein
MGQIISDVLTRQSTMRSEPETLLAHARECERRAAAVNDGPLKGLFLDLALQWRELAKTVRALRADATQAHDFFQNMPHIGGGSEGGDQESSP